MRKAVILAAEGVDGAVAMVAMWGRRQWSRRRNSEEGLVSILNRVLRLEWSVCGMRHLWK